MLKVASRFRGVGNSDRANATAATIQRGTVSASNCPKSCPAIKYYRARLAEFIKGGLTLEGGLRLAAIIAKTPVAA